jgi:hypothetical protein
MISYGLTTDASHHDADRAARQGYRSGPLGEIKCARSVWSPQIALMLASVGVWATSTSQARIDLPAGAQLINPL